MTTIRNYNLRNIMINNAMITSASLLCSPKHQYGSFEPDYLGNLCSCVNIKRFKLKS